MAVFFGLCVLKNLLTALSFWLYVYNAQKTKSGHLVNRHEKVGL